MGVGFDAARDDDLARGIDHAPCLYGHGAGGRQQCDLATGDAHIEDGGLAQCHHQTVADDKIKHRLSPVIGLEHVARPLRDALAVFGQLGVDGAVEVPGPGCHGSF